MSKKLYLGMDIGAGSGVKLGLFTEDLRLDHQLISPLSDMGDSFEAFKANLINAVDSFLKTAGRHRDSLYGVGIACAGIINHDGSFQLVNNLPKLTGHNLRDELQKEFSRPVHIENDANSGGLAEWSVLRMELIYWVFGGGWGGAWISRDGKVRFPSTGWDGNDKSLHFTNEPGYAIPLEKLHLRTLFNEVNASFERFEMILAEDLKLPDANAILGPSGSPGYLRAETILSGPGRCRLFRTLVEDDDFYERFLDIHEKSQMDNPSVAGKHISKLSSMRVEAAINTDRLYGKILAHATHTMLKEAYKDGMPENLPICLGGKPSYALPYFGPSAQRALGRRGLLNYLRPSVIDERGSNANLLGAAVLASQ